MVESHRYRAHCSWKGSTGDGYDRYSRTHYASAPPAEASLALSADQAFGGAADRLNPEQLVLLAAASCQLLSFLAVAARARVDVVAYEDEAEGVMSEDVSPTRLTSITLRPRIVVVAGPNEARVRRLVELGHRECYVASSLLTQVEVQPEIEFTPS